MKNFLVLLFYLTGPIASVYAFLENMPPHPWLFTTHMQRLQPRHFTMIPQPIHRQDISKFFYWKHLLELECFKELCGHFKDRSGHKRPIETTRHRQMPAFRNDGTIHRDHIPNIFKIKENQDQSELQNKKKYPGNERIILWPPERNFTEKQSYVFPTKQAFERGKVTEYAAPRETPERLRGSLKETTPVNDFIHQRTDYRFPAYFLTRPTEPQDAFGYSRTFPENDSPRKVVHGNDPPPELFQNLGVIRSSTATYSEETPYNFRHKVRPGRIRPYEVEEIVEEKFLVDVGDDDKDENSFKSVAENDGVDIRTNEMAKTEHFQSVIDSSVNKILKGLINPVIKLSSDKDVLPSEKQERHQGWRQQTEEVPQKSSKRLFKPEARVDNSRGFDLNPSFGKSLSLTDPPKRPGVTESYEQIPFKIFNTNQFQSDLTDDSKIRSMPVPEKVPELSPIEALTGLDMLRKLMANPLPNFTPTEEVIITTSSASPSTHFLPPLTTSESAEEILPTTEFTTTDSKDSREILRAGGAAALTTQDLLETVKYFPEDDASDVAETEHNFVEFSDRPISFDLLTTTIKLDSEKDQETIWKSSRRMHFGHEPLRTTMSNGISANGEGQQRRSDILITDNLADYVDDDSKLSTLSYLERLKQDNALLPSDPRNLTLDALIPFIPVVINDLREDKIPPEDIPMLSQALGKYWSSVLALSNFTNLDMLPLVKMKNQNDLENVLHNFLPEVKSSTTVGTTENEPRTHDDYSQSYDYLDEYKDLYKDILDQDLGDRKRRFRPRRDAEDAEDHLTLEATREYFDSIEQETSEEGSDYIFEDIVYDEVSEGEDESVFELMEVSDVHINKET